MKYTAAEEGGGKGASCKGKPMQKSNSGLFPGLVEASGASSGSRPGTGSLRE